MSASSFRFAPAQRVQNLPPYVFARVFAMRDTALARGQRVFDMGVGNPDGRPPEHVIEALVTAEIEDALAREELPDAFSMPRRTFYLGRWIDHGGWYPDRKVRLFKKNAASWHGRIHERLQVTGDIARLSGEILHFTYRDISDHVRRLDRYSSFQAEEIVRQKIKFLLLRLLLLPPTTFIRHFVWRLGFLDGFAGLVIAMVSSWGTALKYFKAIALKRSASR